jgi:hypothetical protein
MEHGWFAAALWLVLAFVATLLTPFYFIRAGSLAQPAVVSASVQETL